MVRRIAKSSRFTRSVPSIKPTRVTKDVPTKKEPTRKTTPKKATAPPPKPSPVISPIVTQPTQITATRKASARVVIPSRTVTPTRKVTPIVQPSPVVQPKTPTKRTSAPAAKPKVVVQEPTIVTKTTIKQDPKTGDVQDLKEEIAESPTAVQETKPKVPLIPGVPGLVGGATVLASGGGVNAVPFQETTPKTEAEQAFKLEGFKPAESKGGAEALDLSERVLSEERIEVPTEELVEVIPGGEPTTETRTFIDPATGLLTTETVTTVPGDIEVTTQKGGEIVKQQIGQSEVKPDVSDPLGSFTKGATQSALNEVIGIKNIPAAVTGGEQEELFATPSGILGEGLFSAVGRLGGQIFDIGRQAAGKPEAKPGEQITTFGIGGDQITFEQQERGPDAFTILEQSGQRATRIAVADPLFAVGDIAVQVPLLVVAPVKAASVAIKGIGAAGKAVKVASKGVGAVKGRKLISASGKAVTEPRPKTPLSKTFEEEFTQAQRIQEARAPDAAKLQDFGSLSKAEQNKVLARQRNEFELALTKSQEERPKFKRDLGPAEETAEFAQARRDASEFAKIPKERISPSQIDPDLQKAIKELEEGGDPSRFQTGFTETSIDLGRGIGRRLGDDIGDIDDVFKGGGAKPPKPPTPPPSGFTGAGVDLGRGAGIARQEPTAGISGFTSDVVGLGTGVAKKTPKVTKSQIDKLKKSANISEDKAKSILDDAAKKGSDSSEFKTVTSPEGLLQIRKTVAKQTTVLKELEEARKALQKTKSTQKTVASVADQKTQRRLSDLIKKEKAKAKTAGKSIEAEKATQNALRKLINAEKAKTANKAISSTEDILFKKPRKLKGVADEVSEIQISKTRAGILGGVATGVAVGSAVGIGLNQEQINQPKILEDPKLFNKEISRLVKDPTIQIEKTVQQPKVTTVQKPISDTIFQQRQDQRFGIATLIPQDEITKQQTQFTDFTQQQRQQPIQEIITSQVQQQQFGRGFPFFDFGGIGKDEAADDRPQRRFFRLFDIAKTPFGRVEVGLGAQIQSDRPIFEFDEELEKRGKRRERNLAEEFFLV